jgi:hypothetical protein
VLINGDPTRDITATRLIDSVWVQGVKVDRLAVTKLNSTLPEVRFQDQRNPGPRPTVDPDCSSALIEKAIADQKQ